MEEYEQKAQVTAAYRLAYLLRDAGVINDSMLSEFLYPSQEAIVQAEEQKL